MGVRSTFPRANPARAADQVEAQVRTREPALQQCRINLFQTIEESSYDDWDWVMGVICTAPSTRDDLRAAHDRRGQGGYIVNTASMAGFLSAVSPVSTTPPSSPFAACPNRCGRVLHRRHRRIGALPRPGQILHYASDNIRPEDLKASAKPVDVENVKRLAENSRVRHGA